MYLRYGDLSWESAESENSSDATVAAAWRTGRQDDVVVAEPARPRLPVVRVHGVELHAITEADCIRYILDELDVGRGGVVVTPNLDHLRRCVRDLSFGALLAEANLVIADGMPLVWASRLQGTPLPERVAGSDLVSSLSAAAAERGRSIFLLGGAPGTADAAGRVLQDRHPSLKLVGTHCPPFGFENDEREVERIARQIQVSRPDIIYVALGSPKQERLIHRLRDLLPGSWWLGVGNSFSFLSGDVRRAPLWMQRRGLEWLHRLIQEPKRLFKRYILVGVPFAAKLFSRSAGQRAVRWFRKPPMELEPRSRWIDSGSSRAALPRSPMSNNHRQEVSLPSRRLATPREPGALKRIRAVVLLGGTVRATPLSASIDRSILDLPIDESGSILSHWLSHAAHLSQFASLDHLPMRVMVDRHSPEPTKPPGVNGALRIERDLSDYRGTAGVLHDLAGEYNDDDLILVANAAQVLLDPLASIAAALERTQGDVSLVSHQDGTPSGIMLVTCGALRLIPSSGFVDMKEQALPEIASLFNVTVCNLRRPTGLPARSLPDYIRALRHYHRRSDGKMVIQDPLAEDWRPAFAIVEPGAEVDPQARLHDSVVLAGAKVEQGAVLVRSIVCPGGVVRRDRTAVDQFVTAELHR